MRRSESSDVPLLKKLANGEDSFAGPEPLQLWLLPIHLRSRRRFYEDVVKQARRQIDDMWKFQAPMFSSREEFERSSGVDRVWSLFSPLWWGLNDIVGFIDIRMHAEDLAASLFTTSQRPSRTLNRKRYVFRRAEAVPISITSTNDVLRPATIAAVELLASDALPLRRQLDVARWRPLVYSTDLAALYRMEFGLPSA